MEAVNRSLPPSVMNGRARLYWQEAAHRSAVIDSERSAHNKVIGAMKHQLWVLALVLCSVRMHAAILEGPITNPSNGHAYYLLDLNTWTNSELEAVSLGGHLVTINDAAEQSWIVETFGSADRSIWIGFTDAGTEGVWRWVSGQPATYTNWASGEPNNDGPENWGHLWPVGFADRGSMWNDAPSQAMYSIVEVEDTRSTIEVASVAISWRSISNRLYQVQMRPQVGTNSWQNLGGLVVGTGQTNTIFDTVLGQQRRFYRIVPAQR